MALNFASTGLPPLLMIALDDLDELERANLVLENAQTQEEILAGVGLSESEQFQSWLAAQRSRASDLREARRIPLPLSSTLGVLYTGSTFSMSSSVNDSPDGKDVVTRSNSLTVSFQVAHDIAAAYKFVDTLLAIMDKAQRLSSAGRYSFYSDDAVMISGKLQAVTRTATSDINVEFISMTFQIDERYEDQNREQEKVAEVPPITSEGMKDLTDTTQTPEGNVSGIQSLTRRLTGKRSEVKSTNTLLTSVETPSEDIPDGFLFYEILSDETMRDLGLPDWTSESLIGRTTYRMFITDTFDYNLQPRDGYGVSFNNEIVTRYDETIKFSAEGNLCLITVNAINYLGVRL